MLCRDFQGLSERFQERFCAAPVADMNSEVEYAMIGSSMVSTAAQGPCTQTEDPRSPSRAETIARHIQRAVLCRAMVLYNRYERLGSSFTGETSMAVGSTSLCSVV